MISKLKGTITDLFDNFIILDVGGVGYKVILPIPLLSQVKKDEAAVYYIHTQVRDDDISLYGFSSRKEMGLFEMLLGVSGVGPKTALAVLNIASVDEIISAIAKADASFFQRGTGVGKKNSQRIIVELATKVGNLGEIDLTFAESEDTNEIIGALLGFGFSRPEINKVLRELPKEGSIEDKIREGLKRLGKK